MTEFFKKITKSDIRNVLALITTIGCFVLLYLLQVRAIPTVNKDIINIAVGFVFGGMLSGVSGYYFGASKSDKENSDDKV